MINDNDEGNMTENSIRTIKAMIVLRYGTQCCLARKLGWADSALSNIITGIRCPQNHKRNELSRALGIKRKELDKLIDS